MNEDYFANMSDEDIISYIEDIEADNYLSSIEAHDEPFVDCFLPY